MKKTNRPGQVKDRAVIALKDLAPRTNPSGGGGVLGKAVFGEGPVISSGQNWKEEEKKARKRR